MDPGVDYRRKNLGGADKLYFNTSIPEEEAEENMNGIFKFMAAKETDDVRPITIRIKGRDVHFNKHCGGVLDCDFEVSSKLVQTTDLSLFIFEELFFSDRCCTVNSMSHYSRSCVPDPCGPMTT